VAGELAASSQGRTKTQKDLKELFYAARGDEVELWLVKTK
jgi:hypothetical protein